MERSASGAATLSGAWLAWLFSTLVMTTTRVTMTAITAIFILGLFWNVHNEGLWCIEWVHSVWFIRNTLKETTNHIWRPAYQKYTTVYFTIGTYWIYCDVGGIGKTGDEGNGISAFIKLPDIFSSSTKIYKYIHCLVSIDAPGLESRDRWHDGQQHWLDGASLLLLIIFFKIIVLRRFGNRAKSGEEDVE